MPFAVVGANAMVDVRGKKIRGRLYPWGVVEVENPSHCDFVKLRTMLITHMQDLQEVTNDVHYENYRSQSLAKQPSENANSSGGAGVRRPPPILDDKDKQLQVLFLAFENGFKGFICIFLFSRKKKQNCEECKKWLLKCSSKLSNNLKPVLPAWLPQIDLTMNMKRSTFV